MKVSDLMQAMADAGAPMSAILIAVRALEERDAALEHKRSVERDRKRRQRAKDHDEDGTVTGQSRDTTGTRPGHDRDKSENPSLSRPPNENKSNPPTHTHPDISPRARKGTRLSLDWQPEPFSDDLADAVARWPAGAMERELARFRDWAASAPGQKGVKTDWQATWRNWCRRKDDEGLYRNGSNVRTSGHQGPDRRNGLAKAIDRELARTASPAFPEMPASLECHAAQEGWR